MEDEAGLTRPVLRKLGESFCNVYSSHCDSICVYGGVELNNFCKGLCGAKKKIRYASEANFQALGIVGITV